jgi:hypothetical protein
MKLWYLRAQRGRSVAPCGVATEVVGTPSPAWARPLPPLL